MLSVGELKRHLEQHKILERLMDENKQDLVANTVLQSFHHLTGVDLMPGMILASYLALWLKRCMVPSALRKCLTLKILYLAVLLASKHF